jgi:cobalt-zinc-cadmium efflux system outer membrane protein
MSRLALLGLGLLGGCATVDPRPAFLDVQRNVERTSGHRAEWARTAAGQKPTEQAVDEALRDELTLDEAVRVALLNNPSLQATFEEVGVSQADLAQASRIANPTFSASSRWGHPGAGANVELSLVQDLLDVLAQPMRKGVAAAALEQTKLRVADEVLSLAAEVKEAYLAVQAQQQLVIRLRLVADVTEAAANFARKQREAGTIDDLALENQLALHRQSRVDVALAEAQVRSDRERLNRLLGLWGTRTAWRIAGHLPELPAQEIPLGGLESLAVARRQDLQAARWGVDLVGRALALKRRTRWFPIGVEVGIDTEKDVTGERVTGPSLSLRLPIFDTGKASLARLEAEHRRAQRQLEALAINARSEVREARDRMLSARELAAYFGQVDLPQRIRILELTVRQYNAMFKGAYDVLLAKQAQVEAEKAYLAAWRDYWIARAHLEKALGGTLPGGPAGAPAAGGAAPSRQEESQP